MQTVLKPNILLITLKSSGDYVGTIVNVPSFGEFAQPHIMGDTRASIFIVVIVYTVSLGGRYIQDELYRHTCVFMSEAWVSNLPVQVFFHHLSAKLYVLAS